MNEIGSEFWKTQRRSIATDARWSTWPGSKRYYVSGRSALDAILESILTEHNCHNAYLPSYCCHTMIEPFFRHGIAVEFYSVMYDGKSFRQNIDPTKKCDIILVMDYFGFVGNDIQSPKDSLVIRDMTHVLFSRKPEHMTADYLFASFRKWDAIAGAAVACKTVDEWASDSPKLPHEVYIRLRNEGYRLKASYMSGERADKQTYLNLFRRAEELLDRDYIGYCADEVSLKQAAQLDYCIQARRDNAKVILDGLKEIRIAEPLFPKVNDDDVPLFVPIFVKDGKRNALRQHLINSDVYCPVHWPVSELYTLSSQEMELYEREISLICDQRYGKADMMHQLDVIRSFEEKHA